MPVVGQVPEGSIYVWCYVQGLRGVSWEDILLAIAPYDIVPRDKDHQNWLDGMKKFLGQEFKYEPMNLLGNDTEKVDPRVISKLSEYDLLDVRDPSDWEARRWVPCNHQNRPLVKWSEVRCTLDEARFWPQAKYLAENLKGCGWIVLDFDVDHDKDNIDLELREFGLQLLRDYPTQALYKPDWMGFHLSYWTNLDIPTKHLPHVKIDICGNSTVGATGKGTHGQLRYFKTKQANDVPYMATLTQDIWDRLQDYSLTREVYRKVRNLELL